MRIHPRAVDALTVAALTGPDLEALTAREPDVLKPVALGLDSRAQVVVVAYASGLVTPDGQRPGTGAHQAASGS
ncbi:hypothetical protein ACW4TU_12150 [Streptomyces sp. QTS52]